MGLAKITIGEITVIQGEALGMYPQASGKSPEARNVVVIQFPLITQADAKDIQEILFRPEIEPGHIIKWEFKIGLDQGWFFE